MTIPRTKLLVALVALFAIHTAKIEAATTPPRTNFFSGATNLGEFGNGYSGYYLDFFKYYAQEDANAAYIYKFNFGFLYFFDPASGDLSSNEAYFYDFTTGDFFYTSTTLYPYFYSFNKSSFLYYFEGSSPREFYNFGTSSFITY